MISGSDIIKSFHKIFTESKKSLVMVMKFSTKPFPEEPAFWGHFYVSLLTLEREPLLKILGQILILMVFSTRDINQDDAL